MDLQALVDAIGAQWQRERSASQMTLGQLVAALEAMPPDAQVANLREPHSYRGYYVDLAFERNEGTRPAAELLAEARGCMGQLFEGYKGGEYWMNAATPLWVAHYGSTGQKLMALGESGGIETEDDE